MIIQFNTDKTINGDEKNSSYFNSIIEEELKRFSDHITRIEVHLTDENGNKEGLKDRRCLLEARIENRQPIAVTNHASTNEEAVTGALEKLKISLETIHGKVSTHQK